MGANWVDGSQVGALPPGHGPGDVWAKTESLACFRVQAGELVEDPVAVGMWDAWPVVLPRQNRLAVAGNRLQTDG